MGELVWSIFANPRTIAGPGDAPVMLGIAFLVFLLTLAFMATLGRLIIRTSHTLAILIGAAFVPAIIVVIAFALLWSAPDGPLPNDGSAMLFMALFVLSICALPISLASSAIFVARHHRKNVG